MKAVIDIILIILLALCTWNGYKRGVVVISLLGASILSAAYAHEVVPAIEPFIDGYVDSSTNRGAILERMGYGNSDYSLEDILKQDSSLRYDYAYECLSDLGLYEKRAEELAAKAVARAEETGSNMTKAVVDVVCDMALASIGNLSFRLPNLESVDEIGGAILGFAKGFLYCVLLCWLLSYLGALIGRDTMSHTTLGRFFLIFDSLTSNL